MLFERNAMFRVPKREHMTLTDGGLYTASCRSTNTGGTSNTRERVCILSTEKIIGDADDCRWPEHTWPKTRARFLGFASDGRGFRRNLNLHGGSLHCLCVEKKLHVPEELGPMILRAYLCLPSARDRPNAPTSN